MYRKPILLSALLLCSLCAGAQNLYQKFDNAIRNMLMGGMDSTYVALPTTSWEVPIVAELHHTSSIMDEKPVESPLVNTIGIGIGYHGLDFVASFPTGKDMSHYFSFDYYDNMWGAHIVTSGCNGGENGAYHTNSLLLSGYYAFNGDKCSYPAAIYGNYIQKRSAGTPLIQAWYLHRSLYGPILVPGDDYNEYPRIASDLGVVTAGYGYNISIHEGQGVINLSECIGITFPFGCAMATRIAAMWWFNEHMRVSANYVSYLLDSSSDKAFQLKDINSRATLNFAYCF